MSKKRKKREVKHDHSGHDHSNCGHNHDKPVKPSKEKIEYVDNRERASLVADRAPFVETETESESESEPEQGVGHDRAQGDQPEGRKQAAHKQTKHQSHQHSDSRKHDQKPLEAVDIKIIGKDDSDVTQARNSARNKESSALPKKRKQIRGVIDEEFMSSVVEKETARRALLASSWHTRDNLYQQLFGKPAYVTPANYGPPSTEVPADFEEKYKAEDTSDPGDPTLEEQHLAVLAYGPDPQRPHWTYVTAGLSSPWLQYEPEEVSGFGFEFIVKSPVDAPWAPQLLRTLAFYVFNHAGLLSPGVRVGLNGSIDPGIDSQLRNVFLWYSDDAPDALYELPSGFFAILAAVGMTQAECQFAESIPDYGTWCINAVLRQTGNEQVTDPTRDCSMTRADINGILMSVKNFADTFRANKMQGVEESAF